MDFRIFVLKFVFKFLQCLFFMKPLMDWFMFGMVIETDPNFYMVPFPTQKVLWYMFYIFSFYFAKPSMDFIQLWRDDRALSKILCSTIPIPVHDLKIKVTDFEFFCVKSLQCQLLQNLWLIWIMFGMNGYKILKCFRKEKRVSGELPCPATGLYNIIEPDSPKGPENAKITTLHRCMVRLFRAATWHKFVISKYQDTGWSN